MDKQNITPEKYILYLNTVSAGTIRTLSEALKEVLTDVNVYFDNTGIKIMSMDGAKVALVHLKLDAAQFEQYYCFQASQIGINMLSFFKLLKSIGNNDTLTLYIEKDDSFNLGILIENKDRSLINDIKLKLLDLDDAVLQIPHVAFDSVITMPCVDFQKHCRDLSSISEVVEISSSGDIFCMKAEGDFAKQSISIGETSNGLVISKRGKSVSGRFPLKFLNLFCKSSSLCSSIELYIKDKYPLILIFSVANLGSLKFGLAPLTDEQIN
jgi:proliferating cell nuclear antigen